MCSALTDGVECLACNLSTTFFESICRARLSHPARLLGLQLVSTPLTASTKASPKPFEYLERVNSSESRGTVRPLYSSFALQQLPNRVEGQVLDTALNGNTFKA